MLFTRLRTWGRFVARLSRPREFQLLTQALLRRQAWPVPPAVWDCLNPVRGFLSPSEAGLLYHLARTWPVAGPVLELGSYAGRSTIVFALGGREVHAVDAWSLDTVDGPAYRAIGDASMDTILGEFQHNLARAGVDGQVVRHRGYTQDVGKSWVIPGALLFIDAGHTYPDVQADLRLWTHHLLPGGVLMMHDVLLHDYPGVTRAASELLADGWRVAASAGSIVAFTRADVSGSKENP